MSCIQEEHKTCDLDFRPMTLIINWLLEIVKIQVRAKFRQARCNRSRNRKKNLSTMLKTILPSLPRTITTAQELWYIYLL